MLVEHSIFGDKSKKYRYTKRYTAQSKTVRVGAVHEETNLKPRWFAVLSVILLLGLVVTTSPRALAGPILLDGVVTDGEFLSGQFVPNPNLPGGGSVMSVDQLGLTGAAITIAIEVSDGVLADPLLDGYSFFTLDPDGNITDSNLSLTGTLGDPSMGGLVFQNQLSSPGQIAEFAGGVFNLALSVVGANTTGPFLSAAPGGFLQLTSVPIPPSVVTVGDLVTFLGMADAFTTGTFPVEFFVSSGPGQSRLENTDIVFSLTDAVQDPLPAVPLPGAVWFFLTGFFSFVLARRRKSVE